MKRSLLLILIATLSTPLFAQQPPNAASMSDMFMQQMDADKDGKVSKGEYLKPHEMQFSHMDTSGDGNLDKGEVDAYAKKIEQQMQQMRQQGAPGQPPQGR